MELNRRTFTRGAALALAGLTGAGALGRRAFADPLKLPIGIQLYTVGADLKKDFEGTMNTIAEIGYREIEGAGQAGGGHSIKQIAEFGKSVGLSLRSTHTSIPELQGGVDRIIEEAHSVGIQYVICASPWVKDESRIAALDRSDPLVKTLGKYAVLESMTLDDWRWVTDQLNMMGEKIAKAGMTFGYHNHAFEFKKIGDVLPYDELIMGTDPNYVSFELDCGWMVSAGYDPVAYLTKFPKRYRLLHIKDLAPSQPKGGVAVTGYFPETTEIGSGTIDWKAIFQAARGAPVTGYYVELEPPYKRPPLESARISYRYLHGLEA